MRALCVRRFSRPPPSTNFSFSTRLLCTSQPTTDSQIQYDRLHQLPSTDLFLLSGRKKRIGRREPLEKTPEEVPDDQLLA